MSSFKTFLDGFPNVINLGLVRDKNFARRLISLFGMTIMLLNEN